MTDLELKHYGVQGMKWGVRKNRSDIPTDKESKKLRKKAIKQVKNEVKELKTYNHYLRKKAFEKYVKETRPYDNTKKIVDETRKEYADYLDKYVKTLKDIKSYKLIAGKDYIERTYYDVDPSSGKKIPVKVIESVDRNSK